MARLWQRWSNHYHLFHSCLLPSRCPHAVSPPVPPALHLAVEACARSRQDAICYCMRRQKMLAKHWRWATCVGLAASSERLEWREWRQHKKWGKTGSLERTAHLSNTNNFNFAGTAARGWSAEQAGLVTCGMWAGHEQGRLIWVRGESKECAAAVIPSNSS